MWALMRPWALLLILLPLGVWYFFKPCREKAACALKIPFYQDLAVFLKPSVFAKASLARLYFLTLWTLLCLAFAGPKWIGAPIPLQQEGRNIMMVLDLSGSMAITDMVINNSTVSRLQLVKQAAKNFVNQRQGDRIGLILFGSQAYLQTPLTYDRKNILERIDDATPGLAGQTTAIGDALGLAVKKLQDIPVKSRVIILLTDGANNSGVLPPLKAAELAEEDKIKVYTIGLGSKNPMLNLQAQAELDENTLKTIAKMTNALYFRAYDKTSLQQIYQQINQLEPVAKDQALLKPEKEYFTWPLTLAFILLLLWLIPPLRRPYER